jgi:hypothetical protein
MTYSKDEAWIAHLVCRLLAREIEDAIAPLVRRLDEVERRMDERRELARTLTEATER